MNLTKKSSNLLNLTPVCIPKNSVTIDTPTCLERKTPSHLDHSEIEREQTHLHAIYQPTTTMTTTRSRLNETLEEGELEQSVCSLAEKSWFEECEEAAQKVTVSLHCNLVNCQYQTGKRLC